jgi:hypothetical protein
VTQLLESLRQEEHFEAWSPRPSPRSGQQSETPSQRRKEKKSQALWFMPVILATQKAEIRRIKVQRQPRQIFPETPISKITRAK